MLSKWTGRATRDFMTQDDLDLAPTTELVDAIYRRQGPSGGVLLLYVSDLTNTKEGFGMSYRSTLACKHPDHH